MYLREMKQVYTLGQIEPKEEVYAPGSRAHGLFQKRKVQAFALKFIEQNSHRVAFTELKRFFHVFNDQVLRKALKEVGVDVDRGQEACISYEESIEDKIKTLITPENVCQYESAEHALRKLKKIGIIGITNSNKISFAVNKFNSETINNEFKRYAKLIEHEILGTPWNLSQSFTQNKDGK